LTAPSLLAVAPACCEDEEWAGIPGWPYEASTCGRTRSVDRLGPDGVWRLGAAAPQHPDKRKGKGYLYVNLRDGKRFRRAAVAVVVLEAHRRLRPFPGWEACHSDGVRTDNHLSKLRWDSREGNLADQRHHARERNALASVSGNYANPDETVSLRHTPGRLPRMRFHGSRRYGPFHGHGLKGTVRVPFLSTLPFRFPSLTSSLRSLRSLRSDRRPVS
jgi:hypothetical protein